MDKVTTALHYSGGKDSRVILHMWRDKLDETLVTWVNTGAAYPAVIEHMAAIRASVPHFLEVKSNQPMQIARDGYPTDIVPLHFTPQGRVVRETDLPFRLQDTFRCCEANIWIPLHEAMKRRNITRIVRGQRLTERYRSPIRSGHVEDGVEYIFPIENWTEQQVFAYLREHIISIPEYYEAGEGNSHDCWSCTGYLDEDAGRIDNLPVEERTEVIRRLRYIRKAVRVQMKPLQQVLDNHDDGNDYLPYTRIR